MGYQTTEEIVVETRPGASPTEVAVTQGTVDRFPLNRRETRQWAGTWRLAPSATAPLGLLLDEAMIAPAP